MSFLRINRFLNMNLWKRIKFLLETLEMIDLSRYGEQKWKKMSLQRVRNSAYQRVVCGKPMIFRHFWRIASLSREKYNVTHLHQDAFEILADRHAAQFHAEVADLEARPLGLNSRLLFTRVNVRHF